MTHEVFVEKHLDEHVWNWDGGAFTPKDWKLTYLDDSGKYHRVYVPPLDAYLTRLIAMALKKKKRTKIAIVYPTNTHNVLLPFIQAANYALLDPVLANRFDCVAAWTRDKSFRDAYQRIHVGESHGGMPVHQRWPVSMDTVAHNKILPWPKGFPVRTVYESQPKVLLGTTSRMFRDDLPEGRKPVALFVDANAAFATANLAEIEAWWKSSKALLLIYVVPNPVHPVLRGMSERNWHVIGWGSTEIQPPARPAHQTPFDQAIQPLSVMADPDSAFILHACDDPELESIMRVGSRGLIESKPSGPAANWRLYNLRRAAFNKMLHMATPYSFHAATHVGKYASRSLQGYADLFDTLSHGLRKDDMVEATRAGEWADLTRRAIELLKERPAGKSSELETMLHGREQTVLIGAETYSEVSSIINWTESLGLSHIVDVKRLDDIRGDSEYDEVWLTGTPSIFRLGALRAGASRRIRIFVYAAIEDEYTKQMVQLSVLPTLHSNHGEQMVEQLKILSDCVEDISVPTSQQRPPKILLNGERVETIDWKDIIRCGQSVQQALATQSRDVASEDDLERYDETPRVCVTAENVSGRARTVWLLPDQLVERPGAREPSVLARNLKPSDTILLSTKNQRQSVLATIMEDLEENSEVSLQAYMAKAWWERLEAFREDAGMTTFDLMERFQNVRYQGHRTKLTSNVMSYWTRGHVTGPGEEWDLYRVLEMIGDPSLIVARHTMWTSIQRMRTLHQRVMTTILKAATGEEVSRVSIDEDAGLDFSSFSDLFEILIIKNIKVPQ